MKLAYVPLLKVQREIYAIPAGAARFRAYLRQLIDDAGNDLRLPLGGLNPMGREHVPALLDAYLGLDADGVADRAAAGVAAEVADAPGDFKLALVIVDDAKGGWTNRASTELEHCRGEIPLRQRGWLVGFLWTSEPSSVGALQAEVRAVVHRAAYVGRHGPARTLRELLAQEGAVLARSGALRPEDELSPDDLAYTRDILQPHLDATDASTLIGALFGDAAARALGHPPLGLSPRAGFALAWSEARAAANHADWPQKGARALGLRK
jgi:hypothetical protein